MIWHLCREGVQKIWQHFAAYLYQDDVQSQTVLGICFEMDQHTSFLSGRNAGKNKPNTNECIGTISTKLYLLITHSVL